MKTVSSHRSKNSKGKRYSNCTTTTDFHEAVLLMFGPKVCTFVAENLLGLNVHNVMEWHKSKIKPYDFIKPFFGIKMVSSIYKSLKHNLDKRRDIPFMFMEYEMVIEQRMEYDGKTERVYGFCGLKGEQHKYEDRYTFEVRLIIGIINRLLFQNDGYSISSDDLIPSHKMTF